MTARIGSKAGRSELRNPRSETATDRSVSQRIERLADEPLTDMLEKDLVVARRTIAELKATLAEKEETRAALEQSCTGFQQRMIDLALNLREIRERLDSDPLVQGAPGTLPEGERTNENSQEMVGSWRKARRWEGDLRLASGERAARADRGTQSGNSRELGARPDPGDVVSDRPNRVGASDEAVSLARSGWERTFDVLSDLIMILDAEHRIVRVNRAMAKRLGVAPTELMGRSCHEIIYGEEEPHFACLHSGPLAGSEEASVELSSERLRGAFDVRVVPLFDGIGRYAGSVHIARDISRDRSREHTRWPTPATPL